MLQEKRWPNVLEAVERCSRNRWNFNTSQGYFGWAPPHAEEGDKVYLLLGAEVPILLKPVEDEFTLVGECYVHGLMNGEGLVRARGAQQSVHSYPTTRQVQTKSKIPLQVQRIA